MGMTGSMAPSLSELVAAVREAEVVALASQLLRIPSVNPKDAADCQRMGIEPGEGQLVEVIAQRLNGAGIEAETEELAPGRPNLVARVHGYRAGPVLAFNAHTDTVGAYAMGHRAFHPEVQRGALYGRGAVDMKGALACFIIALELLSRHADLLAGEVVLTAVIGEEGPPSGSEYLPRQGFHPDGIIVGEASGCRIFNGQRGGQFVRLTTQGKSGHGSMPSSGLNAIDEMLRLLAAAPQMDIFTRERGRYGAPTWSVGTIQGGVRTNIIPEACSATVDVRIPPGIEPGEVLGSIEALAGRLGISARVEAEETGYPAYLTAPDSRLVRLARKASRMLRGNDETDLAPFWSDLAYFAQRGVPGVVIGPGSILQAHSDDEYVEVSQLVRAAQLYVLIAALFCGGGAE
jgi:acetylornithine deacetylase/succinyl-diaminopimelate desuccinylase family protein